MVSTHLRRTAFGLLALTLVAAAAEPASAQTTLRYKFKKGEQLNYVLEQKITMAMNFMGKDINTEMSQTMDMTWDIKDVDASGNAKMTQKFDRIRLKMDGGPAGNIDYDSKDGKEPEGLIGKTIGPMFKALAGAEINMTMDAQGKVSDVKVPEKVAKALKSVPGGGAGFGDLLSEDGLKHMMDQSGLQLPKEAISKGKSWDQNMEMKTTMATMKMEMVNTLEGPVKRDGKELERISQKPKISLSFSPDLPIKVNLKSQDNKGTAYFDNAAGRLVETNMVQKLEMAVSAGGMEIAQKMNQTATLKLVPKQ
jgi:hypothetical protein